jgi:hypothetical protein
MSRFDLKFQVQGKRAARPAGITASTQVCGMRSAYWYTCRTLPDPTRDGGRCIRRPQAPKFLIAARTLLGASRRERVGSVE